MKDQCSSRPSNVRQVIDLDGPDPIYQQLADILRAQIADGTLPPNRPVPSITTLVQTYGVARGTAIHALEVLRDEGLVRTVQGRGTFVIGRSAV
jgi:DNA-binding GntR family transcriptional regulator